jgi:hypothetical protein
MPTRLAGGASGLAWMACGTRRTGRTFQRFDAIVPRLLRRWRHEAERCCAGSATGARRKLTWTVIRIPGVIG